MANLHSEFEELKPKGEINSLFLVLHPSLGVPIVETVGSHLNEKETPYCIGNGNKFV